MAFCLCPILVEVVVIIFIVVVIVVVVVVADRRRFLRIPQSLKCESTELPLAESLVKKTRLALPDQDTGKHCGYGSTLYDS